MFPNRCPLALLGLVACAGPDTRERIETWVEAQHVSFADCGTSDCDPDAPETAAARQCLGEAEIGCTPARLLTVETVPYGEVTGDVFVLPTMLGCELHVFVDGSGRSDADDLTHLRCGELEFETDVCLQFSYCERVTDDAALTSG